MWTCMNGHVHASVWSQICVVIGGGVANAVGDAGPEDEGGPLSAAGILGVALAPALSKKSAVGAESARGVASVAQSRLRLKSDPGNSK